MIYSRSSSCALITPCICGHLQAQEFFVTNFICNIFGWIIKKFNVLHTRDHSYFMVWWNEAGLSFQSKLLNGCIYHSENQCLLSPRWGKYCYFNSSIDCIVKQKSVSYIFISIIKLHAKISINIISICMRNTIICIPTWGSTHLESTCIYP